MYRWASSFNRMVMQMADLKDRLSCNNLCILIVLVVPMASCCRSVNAADKDIPNLTWRERSDWINVKTDVTPPAIGDGKAGDTAAIQSALDQPGNGRTVYLPPGTYKITQSLILTSRRGWLIVGHGRATNIVWNGVEGGRMVWSNGASYCRYVGLNWHGNGKAAVGFDHASEKGLETELLHEHEAYRGFRTAGIRVGHDQTSASAEIVYHNCLFDDCENGLSFETFNIQ